MSRFKDVMSYVYSKNKKEILEMSNSKNNIHVVVLRYDDEGDEVLGVFTSHQKAQSFIEGMYEYYKMLAVIIKPDLNPDINSTRYKP